VEAVQKPFRARMIGPAQLSWARKFML